MLARTTSCSRRCCATATARAYARPRDPSSARSAATFRLRGLRPVLQSGRLGEAASSGGEDAGSRSRRRAGPRPDHPATYRVLRRAWQACSSRCSWASSPSRRRSRSPTSRTATSGPSMVPPSPSWSLRSTRRGREAARTSLRETEACVAYVATRRASAPPESAGGPRCARPAPPAAPGAPPAAPASAALGDGQGVHMPQVLQLGPPSGRTGLLGHGAALRARERPQRPQERARGAGARPRAGCRRGSPSPGRRPAPSWASRRPRDGPRVDRPILG